MKGSTTALLCLLITATLGVSAARTAAADSPADKSRVVTTDDGWQLRITKTQEHLDRVPNLAATPFTREGFVSLEAVADISGRGRVSVNSGSLTLGYQIGCQVDVSNGLSLGLSGIIGPSVNVSVGSGLGANVGGSAAAIPSIVFAPKPGTITTVPFATKALAGPHGSITTEQVQIKVDSCMGPVTIRSYAIVSMSTATADNAVAVYGDPIWL